jgi:hypothetical protein
MRISLVPLSAENLAPAGLLLKLFHNADEVPTFEKLLPVVVLLELHLGALVNLSIVKEGKLSRREGLTEKTTLKLAVEQLLII